MLWTPRRVQKFRQDYHEFRTEFEKLKAQANTEVRLRLPRFN